MKLCNIETEQGVHLALVTERGVVDATAAGFGGTAHAGPGTALAGAEGIAAGLADGAGVQPVSAAVCAGALPGHIGLAALGSVFCHDAFLAF